MHTSAYQVAEFSAPSDAEDAAQGGSPRPRGARTPPGGRPRWVLRPESAPKLCGKPLIIFIHTTAHTVYTTLCPDLRASSGCIAGAAFTGMERKAGEGTPQRARAPPSGEGEASTST